MQRLYVYKHKRFVQMTATYGPTVWFINYKLFVKSCTMKDYGLLVVLVINTMLFFYPKPWEIVKCGDTLWKTMELWVIVFSLNVYCALIS